MKLKLKWENKPEESGFSKGIEKKKKRRKGRYPGGGKKEDSLDKMT